jgi:hypothetical protein
VQPTAATLAAVEKDRMFLFIIRLSALQQLQQLQPGSAQKIKTAPRCKLEN